MSNDIMKILLFADTHGSSRSMERIRKKSNMADILVCAGDFTIFESDMSQILRELNNIGKPLLIIHGNHETSSSVMLECEQLNNLHFIHKHYHILENIVFYGFGGGGFSSRDESFRRESELFMQEFKRLSEHNDHKHKNLKLVLITHAPPYKTKLDYLGEHVGNHDIKDFILKHKPILAVSGHIHETFGADDATNDTRMINPGPDGILLDL
ncbi:MAG: metallophosphoesterase family protein [Candidatus Woesearchaeota archaeon]